MGLRNSTKFHQDEADIEESWQLEGDVNDALRVLEGWDPIVQKIVKATPSVVDWKLVYRDPLPTWISPMHRIALIGDSAHPFLPTSIQGASQAMEDGTTIAVCLHRAGKANAQEAIQVFEALRYERVRAAQKTGETTRDTWHKAKLEDMKADPESMKLKREPWLMDHDAEAHAELHYDEIVKALRNPHTAPDIRSIVSSGPPGLLPVAASA
jgi:2-polyprenyl-6-methoxyphenol hydroxylase-like FAD-dependent oxidoreductase